MPTNQLMQHTVLVTGSSSGIGYACTEKLLAEGHSVIGISREANKAFNNPNYQHYLLDLCELSNVAAVCKVICHDHPLLNGVISNAGAGHFGGLENFSSSQIDNSITLNLTSHMVLMRHLLPHLKKRKNGNIVLMGSESSLKGARQGTLYCAAKFGLRGFAQALRQEVSQHAIGVSLINPGMVRTPFFDKQTFKPGPKNQHALLASDVAEVAYQAILSPPHLVIDEININPMQHVVMKSEANSSDLDR